MEYTLTTDHDEIRSWVEEHDGYPAIRDKRENRRGIIDICFDEMNPDFQIISWDEFFDTFDALNMVFRYECFNKTCTEYSYSLISRSEEPIEPEGESSNEMPEDVPIENVIPSASGELPDDNPRDTYT